MIERAWKKGEKLPETGREAGKIGITGAATYGVGKAMEASGADDSTKILVGIGTTVLVYGTLSGIQSAVMKPQKVGNTKSPKLEGEGGSGVWDMTEGGGIINGREYSQHAMERMAPDTPSVRAELSRRAEALAESKGLQVGTPEYYQFCQKYVNPRNVPPSVIEDAVRNITAVPGHTAGTFVHQTVDVTVIVNETGKVITVIPK